MSVREIAAAVGQTKGGVSGRLHRMRARGVVFPNRVSLRPQKAREPRPRVRVPRERKNLPSRPADHVEGLATVPAGSPKVRTRQREPEPVGTRARDRHPPQTIVEVQSQRCRWVLPDTRDGLPLVCSAPAPPGSSWCREHRQRVFERGA